MLRSGDGIARLTCRVEPAELIEEGVANVEGQPVVAQRLRIVEEHGIEVLLAKAALLEERSEKEDRVVALRRGRSRIEARKPPRASPGWRELRADTRCNGCQAP